MKFFLKKVERVMTGSGFLLFFSYYIYLRIRKKKIILFYNIFELHYSFISSTVELLKKEKDVAVIIINTFKKKRKIDNVRTYYMASYFVKFLRGDAFITAASSINKKIKPRIETIIHFFHSPVSTHFVYLDNTFNSYSTFFCVGEQHERELKKIFELKEIKDKEFFQVGYGRLDFLNLGNSKYKKKYPNRTSVLIAPSWQEENILKTDGEYLISELIKSGYQVIVRPHPLIKYHQPELLQKLDKQFSNQPQYISEDSDSSKVDALFNSFYEADILISDWSGISFEFASVKERAVIFIDTPQKIQNKNANLIPIEPIESYYRNKIGYLVDRDRIGMISDIVEKCLTDDIPKETLNMHLDNIFVRRKNFGEKASQLIMEIIGAS